MDRRRIVLGIVAGVAIAALVVVPLIWGETTLGLFAHAERLRVLVQGYGVLGPIVIILLHVLQSLTLSLPGQAIEVTSGYVYGPWWGTVYSWIGVIIGSAAAMTLARFLGRPLVERYVPPAVQSRIDNFANAQGTVVIFLLFLIPLLPDDLICFAVGLTPLPLPKLIALVAVARVPGLFVANLIGAQARTVPPAYWGLVGAGILSIGFLYWRYRGRIETAVWQALGRLPQSDESDE